MESVGTETACEESTSDRKATALTPPPRCQKLGAALGDASSCEVRGHWRPQVTCSCSVKSEMSLWSQDGACLAPLCKLLYISSKLCMRAKQLCIKSMLLLSRVFIDSKRQPDGTSGILSGNPYLEHQFVRYIFCSLPSHRQQGYQVFHHFMIKASLPRA